MRQQNHDDERNSAILYALVITFVALVIAKILFGVYWYSAVVVALVIFGVTLALILRMRRLH
jgi:hypothetical protein